MIFKRILLVTWFLISASEAVAADRAGDLVEYRDASVKFSVLVASAESDRNPGALQSKEARGLVSILSDEKRFLDPSLRETLNLEYVMELCEMSNKAVMSLALFNLKLHVDPKLSPQDMSVRVMTLMAQNGMEFSTQLRHLQPFSIRCQARVVPLVTEFAYSLKPEQFTGVRREGLEKMRGGLVNLFAGALVTAGNPNYELEYRQAMLHALADSASVFVTAMDLATRQRIGQIAEAAFTSSPKELAAYIDLIRSSLNNTECKGLCGL